MSYQQLTEYAHSCTFWTLFATAFISGALSCAIAGIGIACIRAYRSAGLLMELESLDAVISEFPDQFNFDIAQIGTLMERFRIYQVIYARAEGRITRLVFTDRARHPDYTAIEYRAIRTHHASGRGGVSIVPRKILE